MSCYEGRCKIPDDTINQDIADTEKEINNFSDELEILNRNPADNELRIYMTMGKISDREGFIKKLKSIFSYRKNQEVEK